MAGTKRYLPVNVYDAAQDRLATIFREFSRIYVSFSGGKDSSLMLHLVLQYMRRHGIRRRIGVLFIDLEGQYRLTVEHIERVLTDNTDLVDPFWVCLPLNLRNAVSMYEPFWCCWEPGRESDWVRPMPTHPSVISDQRFFPFFRYRMEFEEFVPEFGRWYGRGQRTACLVGIRTDESLNRWRTIASQSKERLNGLGWTTLVSDGLYNCYPIYDWRVEDLWAANAQQGFDYNRLYDMMWRAGLSIHRMRICQPYGDDQKIGLNLFRVIEPETWARVVNRVSGANFGNIYCGTKAIGYHSVRLPQGHTWKSYTKLLLSSLPGPTRENYTRRFCRFMLYWHRKGCGLPEEAMAMLPKEAVVTDSLTTRGDKDKRVVRYRRIPDAAPAAVESRHFAPTWRRMAMCILKNDHLCKGLSFGQTKEQAARQTALLEKYRNL